MSRGDTQSRIGPDRMVQSGVIQPRKMLMASILISFLALLVGLILFRSAEVHSGVLPLGIVCILCAFFWGSYPIAYNALGDLFVILFFGFVAVILTEYFISSSLGFSFAPLITLVFVGLIINFHQNNYRILRKIQKRKENHNCALWREIWDVVLFGRIYRSLYFTCLIRSQLLVMSSQYSICYYDSRKLSDFFDKR